MNPLNRLSIKQIVRIVHARKMYLVLKINNKEKKEYYQAICSNSIDTIKSKKYIFFIPSIKNELIDILFFKINLTKGSNLILNNSYKTLERIKALSNEYNIH